MADPAGLAFRLVALASLFTTCVELIEYFELSKSYEYDYEKACLKLSLLKSRLESWGEPLRIRIPDDCLKEQELGTDICWPTCETALIYKSLRGIADIFGSAELLKNKYHLVPRKSQFQKPAFATSQDSNLPQNNKRTFSFQSRRISLVRRSTSWAIRDKTKFDNLIGDLEFFISNLEAMSTKLQVNLPTGVEMDSKTIQSNLMNGYTQINPTGAVDGSAAAGASSQLVHRTAQTNPQSLQPVMATRESSQQQPELQTPDTQRIWTTEGHRFEVQVAEEKAAILYGSVGGAPPLQPAPAGQVVSYNVTTVKGNARVVGGTIGSADFQAFMNN